MKSSTSEIVVLGVVFCGVLILLSIAGSIMVNGLRDLDQKNVFDAEFTQGKLDMSLVSNFVKLGETGSPAHASISEVIPRETVYIGFAPRVFNIFKCKLLRMPINASGILAFTSSEEPLRIEIKMPKYSDEWVEVCALAGYEVKLVLWGKAN